MISSPMDHGVGRAIESSAAVRSGHRSYGSGLSRNRLSDVFPGLADHDVRMAVNK